LFDRIETEVIAPSQHALDLWHKGFPSVNVTSRIIPHVRLDWMERSLSPRAANMLKIGFVGFPVEYKGWGAWKRLTEKIGKDPRFQFFYFSNDWGGHGNYERIVVTVTRENRLAMTEALIQNSIDVTFLWSICPETFSYTLYESLAAGCFIITNQNSGNIQYYLHNNPEQGMVLEQESQLERLFLGEELLERVQKYQENGKPRGKLTFPGEVE
jgi:glycosyltransferase involved in cell wall biosynthesis